MRAIKKFTGNFIGTEMDSETTNLRPELAHTFQGLLFG